MVTFASLNLTLTASKSNAWDTTVGCVSQSAGVEGTKVIVVADPPEVFIVIVSFVTERVTPLPATKDLNLMYRLFCYSINLNHHQY